MDDLVDQDRPPTVLAARDLDRLDAAVDLQPLAQPIVADGLTSRDAAAFPAVWPVDVSGHGRQGRVDRATVEGGVEGPDPLFHGHGPTIATVRLHIAAR